MDLFCFENIWIIKSLRLLDTRLTLADIHYVLSCCKMCGEKEKKKKNQYAVLRVRVTRKWVIGQIGQHNHWPYHAYARVDCIERNTLFFFFFCKQKKSS